jgi:hypothetical protein
LPLPSQVEKIRLALEQEKARVSVEGREMQSERRRLYEERRAMDRLRGEAVSRVNDEEARLVARTRELDARERELVRNSFKSLNLWSHIGQAVARVNDEEARLVARPRELVKDGGGKTHDGDFIVIGCRMKPSLHHQVEAVGELRAAEDRILELRAQMVGAQRQGDQELRHREDELERRELKVITGPLL